MIARNHSEEKSLSESVYVYPHATREEKKRKERFGCGTMIKKERRDRWWPGEGRRRSRTEGERAFEDISNEEICKDKIKEKNGLVLDLARSRSPTVAKWEEIAIGRTVVRAMSEWTEALLEGE